MATEQAVSWRKTLVVSGVLLLVAGGAIAAIFSTEPTAARGGATRRTEMLVDVTQAERGASGRSSSPRGRCRPRGTSW